MKNVIKLKKKKVNTHQIKTIKFFVQKLNTFKLSKCQERRAHRNIFNFQNFFRLPKSLKKEPQW